MSLELAEQAVRRADLQGALRLLTDHVRSHPDASAPRVFLFQLLAVLGQWDRARTQLDVAADLDVTGLAMAQMYREALRCEADRARVFAGESTPLLVGEPDEWVRLLLESLLTSAPGTPAAAVRAGELRERAFAAAPATAGAIDGTRFDWIADGDMRLGPICEAIVNGRYYWVPFAQLARIELEAPADLRDVVWMPARLTFRSGDETVAVIPTRYPGSAEADNPRVRLGRQTEWHEAAPGVFHGVGQRLWVTDTGEHALMDVRTVVLGEPGHATADEGGDA